MKRKISTILVMVMVLSLVAIPALAYSFNGNATANAKATAYILPSTSSQTVWWIDKNDKLEVICKDGDFYLLLYPFNNTKGIPAVVGYVAASAVNLTGNVPNASTLYQQKSEKLNAQTTVYHNPSTGSLIGVSGADNRVRTTLSKGADVKVQFERDGFYFIQTSSTSGFIEKSKICTHTNTSKANSKTTYVKTADAQKHNVVTTYDTKCNDCGEIVKTGEKQTTTETHTTTAAGDTCSKCGFEQATPAPLTPAPVTPPVTPMPIIDNDKPSASTLSSNKTEYIENESITFTWTSAKNAKTYDLHIYKDGVSERYEMKTGVISPYQYKLPIGSYKIRIYSVNGKEFTGGNEIKIKINSIGCQHTKTSKIEIDRKYVKISDDLQYHNVEVYYNEVCDDCNTVLVTNKKETKKEYHIFNASTKTCDLCGLVKTEVPCEHKNVSEDLLHKYYEEIDDKKHNYIEQYLVTCVDCEAIVNENKVVKVVQDHTFVNDSCSQCGYEKKAPAITQPIKSGIYNIVNKQTGKYLNAYAGKDIDGTNVVQWAKDGSLEQLWNVQALANGSYKIYAVCSSKGQGRVLEANGSTNSGTNAVIWSNYSTRAAYQEFVITKQNNGYSVQLSNNQKVGLTVTGNLGNNNANVVFNNYTGANTQQWEFVAASIPANNSSWSQPMATSGRTITQKFGAGWNKHRGHLGVDLSNASRPDILAITDGVVTYVNAGCTHDSKNSSCSCGGGYGNIVILKHTISGKTFYSAYGHMRKNSVAVKKGDTVKAGQKIGTMGTTGFSTGDHLHIAVYSPGVSTVPQGYFGSDFSAKTKTSKAITYYDPLEVIATQGKILGI